MHRFPRTNLPDDLKDALREAQSELDTEIEAGSGAGSGSHATNAWNKFGGTSAKEKLRDHLIDMSHTCAYCEGDVSANAYWEIEHLKPKSRFPEMTFDWENLHLSCPVCNRNKKDQFNVAYPVIDPCKEEPTEFFAVANPENSFMIVPAEKGNDKSGRAGSTIKICSLNRDKLMKARIDCYKETESLCVLLESTPDNTPNKQHVIDKIYSKAEHGSEYCSVYRIVVNKFPELFEGKNVFRVMQTL